MNISEWEIYQLGKKARMDGVPVTANPFDYGTKAYTYWWDGWQDANSYLSTEV